MRVAVVGGGVFGCTAAIELARTGAQVDLFEARSDILHGATARCQARLHRGYHYPRSEATALAAKDGFAEFEARYPEAVRRARHNYVVAPGSKVTPEQYLAFCDRLGLPYEVVEADHVHSADLVVRVPEAFVDVDVLRRSLRRDMGLAGVRLYTGRTVDTDLDYDLVVRATYGQPWATPLRYELCEVALVELGRYTGESYVIVDGDYSSLDPMGRFYALYDVVHSVHHVSDTPEVPAGYRTLLRSWGPVRTPMSNFDQMVDSAGRFLRCLDPGGQGLSIYAGSLFTVRAVLPDVDATDERPTLVQRDGNVISILSGKICTALTTARQVAQLALVPA